MKVTKAVRQPILQPCSLEGHTYQIDPYMGCAHHCHYCYALNEAETDWTQEIRVYSDLAGQLQQELAALEPQDIYMGWATDPYQPVEEDHRQTRQALELLHDGGFPVCILTKSSLVTRDIDLLVRMPGSSAGFSLAFQDEEMRQLFELSTPPNAERVAALRALKEAGVRTYVLLCPVMPFLSDVDALIDRVAPYADTIWVYAVSMESEDNRNWRNVQRILDQHFPHLTESYREMAFSAEHSFWAELRHHLEKRQREEGLDLRAEL
jgi:DNA repair photolyase